MTCEHYDMDFTDVQWTVLEKLFRLPQQEDENSSTNAWSLVPFCTSLFVRPIPNPTLYISMLDITRVSKLVDANLRIR